MKTYSDLQKNLSRNGIALFPSALSPFNRSVRPSFSPASQPFPGFRRISAFQEDPLKFVLDSLHDFASQSAILATNRVLLQ